MWARTKRKVIQDMSLILEGIDLPKGDTAEIIIRIQPNGEVRDSHGILLDAQAIQINRPHERLIDEREVKKAQFIINDQWGSYPVISLGNLNHVPTILEAEE